MIYIYLFIYLFIDESVTNDTMNQAFSAGVAIKSYDREADSQVLALDVSLDNIVINEGSSENTLYVSGGGLEVQVEIDNTLQIIITGSTEVYGGNSNIILNNVSIEGTHVGEDGASSGPIRLEYDVTVNLTIEGENYIESSGASQISRSSVGIFVPSTSTLVIGGNGILNIKGGSSGIGSNSGLNSGSIIINSGTINATGGGRGAGIGGSAGASITGEIRINGGTVYAQGGMLAAGIGGGGMDFMLCASITTAPNIYISDEAEVTAIAGGVYSELDTPAENIGNGGFSCA